MDDGGEKAAAEEEEEEGEGEEGRGGGTEGSAVTETASGRLERWREKRLPKRDAKCSAHGKFHPWTFRQP